MEMNSDDNDSSGYVSGGYRNGGVYPDSMLSAKGWRPREITNLKKAVADVLSGAESETIDYASQASYVDWKKISGSAVKNRSADECRNKWIEIMQYPVQKGRWTTEEDERLKQGVKKWGESAWKCVSEEVKTRTPQQCLHRWLKSLKASIRRERWQQSEDDALRKAVEEVGMVWSKVQRLVPGRTDVQCRERWMNVLNPNVSRGSWTPDEDVVLLRAVNEVGLGRWAQISAQRFQFSRTDYQIRKRYQRLQEQGPTTPLRASYPSQPGSHTHTHQQYYGGEDHEHHHDDEHSISSLIEAAVATTT